MYGEAVGCPAAAAGERAGDLSGLRRLVSVGVGWRLRAFVEPEIWRELGKVLAGL